MRSDKETLRVRMDAYTRVCLTVIAGLLTVLIIALWADYTPQLRQVQAKGPFVDTSTQTQLVQLVGAQNKTTAKLQELISLLRSGEVKVQLAQEARKSPQGARNDAGTRTTTRTK